MENTLPPTVSAPNARGQQWAVRLRAPSVLMALQGVDIGMRPEYWLPAASTAAVMLDTASGEIVGHAPFDGF
jgi:hypothetical protein